MNGLRLSSSIKRWAAAGNNSATGPTRATALALAILGRLIEAYGMALRRPKQFKDFLRATVEDWLTLVAEPLVREGHTRRQARAFATVVLAGLRGFMLDYCNTGDRKRVEDRKSVV